MRTSALAKRLAIVTGAASLFALSSTMTIANAQLNSSEFDVFVEYAEQCIVNSGAITGILSPTVNQVPVADVDFGLIEAENLPPGLLYSASTSFYVQCTEGTSYVVSVSSQNTGNSAVQPIPFLPAWGFLSAMIDADSGLDIPYLVVGTGSLNRTGNGLFSAAQTFGFSATFSLGAAVSSWGGNEPAGGAVFSDTVLITATFN